MELLQLQMQDLVYRKTVVFYNAERTSYTWDSSGTPQSLSARFGSAKLCGLRMTTAASRAELRSGELVRLSFLPSSSASLCRLSSQFTLSKSLVPPTVWRLLIDRSIADPVFRFSFTTFHRPASASCRLLFRFDSVFSFFVNESLRFSFEFDSLRFSLFSDSDLRSLKESLFVSDSDRQTEALSSLLDADRRKRTTRGSFDARFSNSLRVSAWVNKLDESDWSFLTQHSSFVSSSFS